MRPQQPFAVLFVALCIAPVAASGLEGTEPPEKLQAATVTDKTLVDLLANLKLLGERDGGTKDLSVRVFGVTGASGSAKAESCEVVTEVYVVVSEDGEAPERAVFRVGPLYGPKLEEIFVRGGKPTVFLTYGAADQRRAMQLALSLSEAQVIPQGVKKAK